VYENLIIYTQDILIYALIKILLVYAYIELDFSRVDKQTPKHTLKVMLFMLFDLAAITFIHLADLAFVILITYNNNNNIICKFNDIIIIIIERVL